MDQMHQFLMHNLYSVLNDSPIIQFIEVVNWLFNLYTICTHFLGGYKIQKLIKIKKTYPMCMSLQCSTKNSLVGDERKRKTKGYNSHDTAQIPKRTAKD